MFAEIQKHKNNYMEARTYVKQSKIYDMTVKGLEPTTT